MALPLPTTPKRGLVEIQPPEADGLRVVAESDLHITLHFLGRSEPTVVDKTLKRVEGSKFCVRLTRPGHFGSRRRKRILWVGVEPCAALLDLHARVGAALRAAGYEIERRDYAPHVTVARLGPKVKSAVVESFEQSKLPESISEFECDRFALYASETAPAGARYCVLESYPLAG